MAPWKGSATKKNPGVTKEGQFAFFLESHLFSGLGIGGAGGVVHHIAPMHF